MIRILLSELVRTLLPEPAPAIPASASLHSRCAFGEDACAFLPRLGLPGHYCLGENAAISGWRSSDPCGIAAAGASDLILPVAGRLATACNGLCRTFGSLLIQYCYQSSASRA